jgi:sulfur-carrier protein
MTVTVRIPGSLADWFNGADEVACRGGTLRECFSEIQGKHPGFHERIFDGQGEIGLVLIFVNGENIRNLAGLATKVSDGDEIGIIPLAAGG